jgi:hypothetical protein
MKRKIMITFFVINVGFLFRLLFTDLSGDYLGQTPCGNIPVGFAPEIITKNVLEPYIDKNEKNENSF